MPSPADPVSHEEVSVTTLDATSALALTDVPTAAPPAKSAVQSLVAVVMVVATFLLIAFEAPALFTIWQGPIGYGFKVDARLMIISTVSPPGEALGIRPGMHVLPTGTTPWRLQNPMLGDRISLDDRGRRIVVVASHVRRPAAEVAVATISFVFTFVIILFAGALCYRRPGVMTIAFWIYTTFNCQLEWVIASYNQLPEATAKPIIAFVYVANSWTNYALIWFALRFPDDRIRSVAMRVADYVWTGIALVGLIWFATLNANLGYMPVDYFWAEAVPTTLPLVAAVAALIWVYLDLPPAARQRAVWAITGLSANFVLWTAESYAPTSFRDYPLLLELIEMFAIMSPLALLYAVFRHQLLDISFVVNRALVFSALTTFIVATVGLADYVTGKLLSQTRVAVVVEAAVTIGIGYVLQRVHGALEWLIDRVVFAGRHKAERHLDRVIGGMAYARTRDAVLDAMVDEPQKALDLRSTAAFMIDDTGFTLAAQRDWLVDASTLRIDDPLARLLLAERKPVDVREALWRTASLDIAPGAPHIAVPLFSRNDLIGIVFYGPHRNGTLLDPEECGLLLRLCQAAAVAYEAVAFARTREELAAFRAASFERVTTP